MLKTGTIYTILFVFVLSVAAATPSPASKDWLRECFNKQVKPLEGKTMQFSYKESQNNTYHSMEPWQTMSKTSTGLIWQKQDAFMQLDTVMENDKPELSKMVYNSNELLSLSRWDEEVGNVSRSEFQSQPVELARYSPALLIRYFTEHAAVPDSRSDKQVAIYKLTIGEAAVELWIDKSSCLLKKMIATQNNDLWGDVATTVDYSGFTQLQRLGYAKNMLITKVHGITDTVSVNALGYAEPTVAPLLVRPASYKIEDDKIVTPTVITEQTGKHIYTISLPHTNTKVSLLEFKDFFVIIDVPLSSENGELVLNEARKINPGKRVKYYVFGHHHPWYIGGVRPFIRRGTTVLCTKEDEDYLRFVATAPHTMKPDSLQLHPMELSTELIGDTKTISDGEFELQIIHIGAKSFHTKDYMLFYIPSEKLLIEDDLAWIPMKGPIKKASKRQAAIYNAVKEMGLDVQTVVQHWPDGGKYAVKSTFPFSELEESMNVK